jgi:hypothetical protein
METLPETLKQMYPELETGLLTSGSSCGQYFLLAGGFKDVGQALVFGFLKLGQINDSKNLLQLFENLAREKKINKVIGPLNFSTYFDYRLRLNQFDQPTFTGEPQSSEADLQLFQNCGYQILRKYVTHQVSLKRVFKFFFLFSIYGSWIRSQFKNQVRFAPIELNKLDQTLPIIYQLTDETFSNNFLYQKIDYPSFKQLFNEKYLPTLDLQCSVFAKDPSTDEIIGYGLCLKDPLNPEQVLFKTIGVRKSRRLKGRLALLLLREIYFKAKKNYTSFLACLMMEGNRPEKLIRSVASNTRDYALYIKELNADHEN